MKNTNPSILIHYGLPKTATTTVQNALFSLKPRLLSEAGLLYPGNTSNHTDQLCTAFLIDPRKHISNQLTGMSLDMLRMRGRETLDKFRKEIEVAQPKRIIFSAEGLVNINVQELASFRMWLSEFSDDIKVICVVRDPVTYAASVTQQHLKGGDTLDVMYADPPLPGFRPRIGKACTVFGRENVHVHSYESMAGAEGGVIRAFVSAIDLEGSLAEDVIGAATFDNASLSRGAALLLSKLNEIRPLVVDGKRGALRSEQEVPMLQSIRGAKFQLPPEVVEKAFQKSRSDVDWLNKEFGLDLYRKPPELELVTDLAGDEVFLQTISTLLSNLINFQHRHLLETQLSRLTKRADAEQRQRLLDQIARLR